MKLLLDRKWKKDGYTIGRFYINGVYFSDSVEDKDRGLDASMSPSEIISKKVYGKTAIPTGTYKLVLSYSPKFASRGWGRRYKGQVPEILEVKGFSGVRIHPLNNAQDSLGCVGLGENKQKGMVLKATEYYYKLMDNYLIPASKTGETIWLTIR